VEPFLTVASSYSARRSVFFATVPNLRCVPLLLARLLSARLEVCGVPPRPSSFLNRPPLAYPSSSKGRPPSLALNPFARFSHAASPRSLTICGRNVARRVALAQRLPVAIFPPSVPPFFMSAPEDSPAVPAGSSSRRPFLLPRLISPRVWKTPFLKVSTATFLPHHFS